MKRYILSFGVLLLFATYVFYSRHEDNQHIIIAPPPGLTTTTTATTSTTGSAVATSGTPPPAQATTPAPTPAATKNPTPAPTPTPAPKPAASQGQYKDGSYTGSVADAYFGNMQVQAVVSGGKLTDVVFLQYPSDRGTSREINSQAMPYLKAEAIQAQNANVNIISGATQSSQAFVQSLGNALSQAVN